METANKNDQQKEAKPFELV